MKTSSAGTFAIVLWWRSSSSRSCPCVVFGALVYSRTAKALRAVEQDRITAQATGARAGPSPALGRRAHLHPRLLRVGRVPRGHPRGATALDPQQRHRLGAGQQRDNLVTVYGPTAASSRAAATASPPPCGRALSCSRRATARSAPTSWTWTAGSTFWPPRPSWPRRIRRGRPGCSSSARPSPTACSRASTGSPAARAAVRLHRRERSRRRPTPAEASRRRDLPAHRVAAGQVFTEGDFTNKLVAAPRQERPDRRAAQGLRAPRRVRGGAQRDQRDHHRRLLRRPAHRRASSA